MQVETIALRASRKIIEFVINETFPSELSLRKETLWVGEVTCKK